MLKQTLADLFERDLNRVKNELIQYEDENKIWIVKEDINNSAGNLCLHLVGNLNTYIGRVLGNTNYIRDREAEFNLKNIPRADLIFNIENTSTVIKATLHALTEEDLATEYPELVFKEKTSVTFLLVHLATHLGYHLGQINYHRRLLGHK